ncbi:carbohydrate-binding protein [Domibacillus sp. 8LH]|uniref:carbohydrate-binding protein n=1 Tax=Domibacillus sp. 8LH TaxID=3073900 RepID=UPI00317A3E74
MNFSFLSGMTSQMAHAEVKVPPVQVWVTTPDQTKLLQQQPSINFTDKDVLSETTIHVNEQKKYQQMDGFGASMTDSSAWLIHHALAPVERNKLIESLFNHKTGIGLSYLRVPMGASDFSLSDYTYNDRPAGQADPKLAYFSIKHDQGYIIPTLKNAKKINPALKIMGTPWSPPAWMKTNESIMKGRLKKDAYQAYAQYFIKYVQAYKAEGVSVDAVTVQNEPHYEAEGYPSMRMESFEQASFIKNYLGPAFGRAGVKAKILVWDHNWDEYNYPIEILNDPAAKKYIAGSAFHGYAGDVQNQQYVHDAHPDKSIYFTESSGGEWARDFGGNLKWDMQNLIIGATRNWAKTVLKWNVALDETHGPTNGGCTDCRGMVTIDKKTGGVTYNVEYYAFGHASKFVKPGAYRIDSNTFGSGSIENVAFKNLDGSKVLIALNSSKESREFKIRWGSKSFTYTLPAGAVSTFVWSGTQAGATFTSPYSKIEAEDYTRMYRVKSQITHDAGGGKSVTPLESNAYMRFDNVEFGTGINSVEVRAAAAQSARIEFRSGSPSGALLGSLNMTHTGSSSSWKTKTAEIKGAKGIQHLYVVLKGGVHLNSFQFSKRSSADFVDHLSENGDFEQGSLENWSGWNPDGQLSAQKVDTDNPRGSYKLTHWLYHEYKQTTYQTVKVPNGTYRASFWIRKSSGNAVRLEVKKYGGSDLFQEAGTVAVDTWKKMMIDNIKVTNGQIEIGVFSDSPAGGWAAFDDFELHSVTAAPSS